MSKKLFEILSQVFSVPISEINDESSPDTIEKWDSFNSLVLIDELESAFNLKFTVAEMTDTHSVADIKRHLKNRGVSLDE
ncbi:MAG: acyl carrier protein [Crenarchaeota archaeon]|nr:MAG: acyl carrier protein [Thermoproteota archaeon]RDJ33325.1 MAG: acyl carrier protein [Thermoproteota archaeon]RDJ36172.1 MAG: acyl carrier protein [Thermoproteota archaeon]RDJ38803.1 MAG: acyl carrier protein [Thermoproteota archaeon]